MSELLREMLSLAEKCGNHARSHANGSKRPAQEIKPRTTGYGAERS